MSAALRAGALAAAIVGLDQATKALVRANVDRGSRDAIFPGVELVNGRNTGVAFGLFEGGGAIIAIVTAAAIAALVIFFVLNRARPGVCVPTGMLLGGAIGNLIDRLVRDDGVTDFIKLPLWPAFNVADIAITFGVLALVYVLEGPKRADST